MANITGTSGNDSLDGITESDTIYGDSGNDTLSAYGEGYTVESYLDGGEDDDHLYRRLTKSTLVGGKGSDTYYIESEAIHYGGTINNTADDGATTTDVLNIDMSDAIPSIDNIQFTISANNSELYISTFSNFPPLTVTGFDTNPLDEIVFTFPDGSEVRWDQRTIYENALVGTSEGDEITGLDLDDVPRLFSESFTLSGEGGNDTLYASDFGDTLDGGEGDDVYVFDDAALQYGGTIVQTTEGSDTIQFTGTVTPDDIRLYRSYDDLHIVNASTASPIIVEEFFDNFNGFDLDGASTHAVTQIIFANNVTWTQQDILDALSEGYVVVEGTEHPDIINTDDHYWEDNTQGNDTFNGGNGNDVFITSAEGYGVRYTFDGGAGDDQLNMGATNSTLRGGEGNDTYFVSSGNTYGGRIDNAADDGDVTTDELHVDLSQPSTGDVKLSLSEDGSELFIYPRSSDEGLLPFTVEGFDINPLDKIVFNLIDGSTEEWDTTEIQHQISLNSNPVIVQYQNLIDSGASDNTASTSGDDELNVTLDFSSNKTASGGEGNDTLYDLSGDVGGAFQATLQGDAGDDHLVAGGGRTIMEGGTGSDHYYVGNGAIKYGGSIVEIAETGSHDILHLGVGVAIDSLPASLTPDQVTFRAVGTSLLIYTEDYSSTPFTVAGFFSDATHTTAADTIEEVVFSDGTSWDVAQIIAAATDPSNTTFTFNLGDGDQIIDLSQPIPHDIHTIDFGTGIDPSSMITSTQVENGSISVMVNSPEYGQEKIQINHVNNAAAFDLALTFDNGDQWDRATLLNAVYTVNGDHDTFVFDDAALAEGGVIVNTTQGGDDTLEFTGTTTPEDIRFYRVDKNLYIQSNVAENANPIIVQDFFDGMFGTFDGTPTHALKEITFSGGEVLNQQAIIDDIVAGHVFEGTINGDDIDVIDYYSGEEFSVYSYDQFNAGDGNDTLRASNESYYSQYELNGGADNDELHMELSNATLRGGEGDDTYYAFAGNTYGGTIDNAADDGDSATDILEITLGASSTADVDLFLSENGSQLFIYPLGINPGSSPLTVEGFNVNPLDKIIFNLSDGSTEEWNTTEIINQALSGTEHNDLINGFGEGDIAGYDGNDEITGSDGNDVLVGQEGNDTLSGGDGNDDLLGGNGDDELEGGSGNDYLSAGDGNDTYVIGGDFDTVRILNNDFVSSVNVLRFTDLTADQLWFNQEGNDLYITEVGSASEGNEVNQVIIRSWFVNEANKLDQFEFGENILLADKVPTLLSMMEESTSGLSRLDIQADGAMALIPSNITAYLTNYEDNFVSEDSQDLGDTIDGDQVLDVAETLDGFGGNDTISGYGGDDLINGGSGNDSLIGGDGNDEVLGGTGADDIYGEAGNDTLDGGTGNDTLYGAGGNDLYIFTDNFDQDRVNNSGSGEYDNDVIRIEGVTIDDLWFSQFDDDLVITVANRDDEIKVAQWFTGNTAYKVNQIEVGTRFLTTQKVEELLSEMNNSGVSAEDIATNGMPASILTAIENAWDNENSLEGADNLDGTEGDDLGVNAVNGYGGNDVLHGLGGNDDVYGGTGNDFIFGDAGNDNLEGNEGLDDLFGGSGNDTLNGGEGSDFLYGDDGDDVYVFEGEFGYDRINNNNWSGFHDTVRFDSADLDVHDLWFRRNGADLVIHTYDEAGQLTDNSVTVRSWESENLRVDEVQVDGFSAMEAQIESLISYMATLVPDDAAPADNNFLTQAQKDEIETHWMTIS